MDNQHRIDSYNKTFKEHGTGVKALQWIGYNSIASRYKALTETIVFNDKSIVDIGCGFGDIIPYIKTRADNFKYTGYDINANFIIEAKKRYPDSNYTFIEQDFMKNVDEATEADIHIISGVLNNKQLKEKEIKIFLEKVYQKSKYALAFNMLGGINRKFNKNTEHVKYSNGQDYIDLISSWSDKFIYRQDYHNKDFTIVVYK